MPRKITNVEELKSLIKERLNKIMESEAKSVGDPMDVKMNSMTDEGGKLKDAVGTNDPMSVEMNSELKNGTEETGAQVSVKAGAAKGDKGPTAGQAGAKMEEKSGSEASVKAGDPFIEKPKEGMNKMDQDGDDTTKTYAEAGSGSVGSQPTTVGQKAPDFKEAAPEGEKDKRIADAIQMKEGMRFKNKEDLISFIKEEAKRIADIL